MGIHCRGTVNPPSPQIYNLPGSFPCILCLSWCTMQKCFVSRGDTTPNNGNLRLLLCQTAEHPSLQLHHQTISHTKAFHTWAARLLDEGLGYRDRGPRRQHSIPCILSAEALWAQCPSVKQDKEVTFHVELYHDHIRQHLGMSF